MEAGPDRVIAAVVHARSVPAEDRSAFAARLRSRSGPPVLVLETCHRVEGYATIPSGAGGGDLTDLTDLTDTIPAGGELLVGAAAALHAMRMAVGGDSVVIGEDQILHQLRSTVDGARLTGDLDPTLERLFALALQAGRRARSWRAGPGRSLGDVAIAAIERRAGPVDGRRLLVVGAGQMGRLTARAARSAGATIAVANRSIPRARSLATSVGGRIEAFDPEAAVASYAGIVVAVGGPWAISPATVDALGRSSAVVVDLSVPAAIPTAATERLGDRLITADALARAEAGPVDEALGGRVAALVETALAEFEAWQQAHLGRAAAEALADRADREREMELAALWRHLPDLDPEARDAIERMARHLTTRLLREPLERLGRDGDGRTAQAVRDVFAL